MGAVAVKYYGNSSLRLSHVILSKECSPLFNYQMLSGQTAHLQLYIIKYSEFPDAGGAYYMPPSFRVEFESRETYLMREITDFDIMLI